MSDAGRPGDFTDLNPEYASRLANLRAALDKANIGYSLSSGYRSPEYQNQMYQNHLAKSAGQPLPYPNVEAPDVVAPAWRSFHNYGLAADFTATNPADYARIRAMAPQFGLTGIGASDPGHIQMAGTLADDINQYHLANWRPSGQPAPGQGAVAYTGAPPPSGPLAARGTQDFYHAAMMHESGGKNIPNAAGGWNAAGGYYQFTPPTWGSVRAAHPELNLPENVKDASPDQQTAAYHALTSQNVAALQKAGLDINDKNVFMASFLGGGGATKFLSAMKDNPTASAADLFPAEAKANPTVFYSGGKPRSLTDVYALQTGHFGAGNTTGFGPDAAAAPAVASGATGTAAGPPNPFTAFAPGGAAAPGGKVASSLTDLDKALGGQQPDQQKQGGQALDMQASPMIPGPGAVNVSPLFNPMLGQQMMAQLSRAPARPAQQEPMGTTLNSMAMLDTSPVQFPQVYPSQMGYGGSGYGMGSMSMGGYPSSGGYGYGG